MKKGLLSLVKEEAIKKVFEFLMKYITYKYGSKSDVCLVRTSNKSIHFETSRTNGTVQKGDASAEEICAVVRKTIGDNIMMTHGLPKPSEQRPTVVLLLSSSTLIDLGVEGSVSFMKSWKGNSFIGDLPVVRYINLKDI